MSTSQSKPRERKVLTSLHYYFQKQAQKQLQQQQPLSNSTTSPVIQSGQTNSMFTQYAGSQSQPPQVATTTPVGGASWGNSPMVADPWQNHYHQVPILSTSVSAERLSDKSLFLTFWASFQTKRKCARNFLTKLSY
jgi:hypothetical protein